MSRGAKEVREFSHPDLGVRRFPKKLFIGAVALTCLALVALNWHSHLIFRTNEHLAKRSLRMEELRGVIARLDEVLSASAYLASAKGDPRWEERYHAFEPQLAAAIREAAGMVSDEVRKDFLRQTGLANDRLVAMERQALDLARAGNLQEAYAVMSSQDYRHQKQIYAGGLAHLSRALERESRTHFENYKAAIWIHSACAVVVIIFLIVSAVLGFLSAGQWERFMRKSQQVLADQANALIEINKNLNQKVTERTVELQSSRLAALNMMEDAIEAKMKSDAASAELLKAVEARKKSEEMLLQAQKMDTLGQLTGGIAHDLNNQLTPVQGYLDLLLQQTEPGQPHYQMLAEASQSAQRCVEVIHRLMQFSRPAVQVRSLILISHLFEELKSVIEKFLPATIQVSFVCEKNLWPVEAHETEIQTVLMNLCVNARDAMPQGGRLVVEAKNIHLGDDASLGSKSGPCVLVSVADSGSGMSAEIRKKIFEPFFTTKEKGRGTGLGLSMALKIIHEHQGWIDVSSRLGQGTVFQIFLPAKPGAVVSATKTERGISDQWMSKNEMVLLADDEENVRKLGQILLQKLGYKVLAAQDGEEALRLYKENLKAVNVLMLDMTMPKMTGLALIEKILEVNPKAKIVIASGYTSEGSAQELMARGAADFIQKPYTIARVAKTLRKVLDAPGF